MSPLLEELRVRRGHSKVDGSSHLHDANGKEPVSIMQVGHQTITSIPDEITINEELPKRTETKYGVRKRQLP
jgi:hypothetical protein